MKPAYGLACLLLIAWPSLSVASESLSLEIDYEKSSIEIVAKALGFVPANFVCQSFEASVDLHKDSLAMTRAVFDIPYKNLSSGSKMKDRRVLKWLEVEKYPQGRFEMTGHFVEEGIQLAEGNLLLHGKTKPARFAYETSTKDDGTIQIDGVAKIDYREWGLPIFRVFIFGVNPTLEIRLHLEGKGVPHP